MSKIKLALDVVTDLRNLAGSIETLVFVSIADRLSQQCGDLSHCLRISKPVSAGERAIRTEFVLMALCII